MLSSARTLELRATMSEILKILIVAKESFQYCHYIYFPNTEVEKVYLHRSKDFNYFGHILWRNTVIELSKLLSGSKGDKYSIIRLIDKLRPAGEYSQAGVDVVELAAWDGFINSHQDALEQLKAMRDAIYAHTDAPDKRAVVSGVTFEQYRQWLEFTEGVLVRLYRLYDISLNTRTPIFNSKRLSGIFQVLAADKKNK